MKITFMIILPKIDGVIDMMFAQDTAVGVSWFLQNLLWYDSLN